MLRLPWPRLGRNTAPKSFQQACIGLVSFQQVGWSRTKYLVICHQDWSHKDGARNGLWYGCKEIMKHRQAGSTKLPLDQSHKLAPQGDEMNEELQIISEDRNDEKNVGHEVVQN